MRDNRLTRMTHRNGDAAAFLVGVGGGFLAFGLVEYFFCLFDAMPGTWRVVVGASFAALAVGLWVSHRLIWWFAARVQSRSRGRDKVSPARVWFLPSGKNHPSPGALLGLLGLLCAGTSIVSLILLRLVRRLHEFALEEFLWGPISLMGAEYILVVLTVLFVFIPVGLVWGCVHHVSCPQGGWRVRPLAGVSVGPAVVAGVVGAGFLGRRGLDCDLLLLIGSVPFFLLSVFSFRLSSPLKPRASADAGRSSNRVSLPHLGDGRLTLIRVAVIVVFACGVLSAGIWWRVFDILAGPVLHGGAMSLAMWCLGFAVGVRVACRRSDRRGHSMGTVGLSCVLSGMGLASGAGALGLLGLWAHRLALGSGGACLLSAIVVGLPAFGFGHTTTCGFDMVLRRLGRQSVTGPGLLMRLLLAGFGVIVFVQTWLIVWVGTYAGLAAVSLVAAGVGGVLIVYDPAGLRRDRRLRLGVLLGSVAFICLVLPHAGVDWLMTRSWKRVCLEEHAWLTKSTWAVRGDIRSFAEPANDGPESGALPLEFGSHETVSLPDGEVFAGSLRVALLGTPPQALPRVFSLSGARCDCLLFDPSVLSGIPTGPARCLAGAPPKQEPAARFMRRTPWCYDVIVIALGDLPASTWACSMRAGLLDPALSRLHGDGMVLMAMPIRQTRRAELAECLTAIQAAGCDDVARFSTMRGSEATLWLAFGKSPQWRECWGRFTHLTSSAQ
ncbi:MAG: hypothetical protein KAV82_12240 [Phycisphaerae bacterium]|nr:hypothetical protein [Phycisphaerae bacterium]